MTALRIIAIVCAGTSLVALVTHVAGLLPMVYFLTFFGVPSVVLLFALTAYARWIDAQVFVRCVVVGVLGGLVSTVAYDAWRFLVQSTGLFRYNGFVAIYIFGSWISGLPATSREAAVVGWVYHFWNGVSFGTFYTLAFGRRRWPWGAAYGVLMEACMLGLFPFFLQVTDRVDFIVVSLTGHLVYGTVLGLLAQRHAANWTDARG